MTTKNQIIIASVLMILSFSAGIASYATLNRAYAFTTDLFGEDPSTYMAKPSEYDQRTQALFNSKPFQASCLSGARSQVALEIAREKKQEASYYLDQYDKESTLSIGIFETPTPTYMGTIVGSSTKTTKK